jgi:hypothetical protein
VRGPSLQLLSSCACTSFIGDFCNEVVINGEGFLSSAWTWAPERTIMAEVPSLINIEGACGNGVIFYHQDSWF